MCREFTGNGFGWLRHTECRICIDGLLFLLLTLENTTDGKNVNCACIKVESFDNLLLMEGIYFAIKRYAIHDGPGIRTSVFLKGCPMACVWCHNPEGIVPAPHVQFLRNRCIECGSCATCCQFDLSPEKCVKCGSCVVECSSNARQLVGKTATPTELVSIVMRDIPFFEQSGGGVTFTGGEPLFQPDFLLDCLKLCRKNSIHTTLDTCGFDQRNLLPEISTHVDLILFDLKIMNEAKHKQYTGVSNSPIKKSLKWLDAHHENVWIRVPVIPNITATKENMEDIGIFLRSLGHTRRVHLLPYHDLGVLENFKEENSSVWGDSIGEALEQSKRTLETYGLEVCFPEQRNA